LTSWKTVSFSRRTVRLG